MFKASRAIVAVASALSLVACADVAPSPQLTPSAGELSRPVAIPTGPSHIESPLQPYMLSARQLATVNYARAVLISGCMEDQGFSYDHGTLSSEVRTTVLAERQGLSRLYGVTDVRVAAVFGYLPAPVSQQAPEPLPDQDDYWIALTGRGLRPTPGTGDRKLGGCVGSADASLGRRPDRSAFGLGRELWISNHAALQRTDGWRRVVSRWSACMAAAGYQVTSPLDDEGDIAAVLARRGDAAAPSEAEVRMAVADASCKRKTTLVPRLNALAWQIDLKSVRRHRAALRAERARSLAILARARAIANKEGGTLHG